MTARPMPEHPSDATLAAFVAGNLDSVTHEDVLGHLERVAWIHERARCHPGLFLAGNAFYGVALNDCTEQAGIVAERIKRYLADPVAEKNASVAPTGQALS